MSEDMLFFWGMGALFALTILLSKPPLGWKYFHSIIFLCYFINAFWEMNDSYSIKHGVSYQGIIIAAFTALHIIIYLIGKLIFGIIRRHNAKSEQLQSLFQENKE